MKKSLLPLSISALLAALVLAGCGGNRGGGSNTSGDKPGEIKYTYNTYLETNPKTWNVHNWETNDESYVPAFTEMGLYDLQFSYNADGIPNGYEIITEMAAAMPRDVTESLTDAEMTKYGYSGNPDKGFVWEIKLNDKAVWENGTPINATTYVESMKRQLDPKMVNFRADSYYASSLVLANAERYFKQGRTTIEPVATYIKDDGTYTDANFDGGHIYYLNMAKPTPFAGDVFGGDTSDIGLYEILNNRSTSSSDAIELAAQRITDGAAYYAWKYCDHEGDYKKDWDDITEFKKTSSVKKEMLNYDINLDEFDNPKKPVYARTTKDVHGDSEADCELYTQALLVKDLKTIVAGLSKGGKKFTQDWSYKIPLFGEYFNNYAQDFDGVGIARVDDYTIKLFLSKAITELDLKFSLSGNWIVDTQLYDSLIKVTSGGLKSTTYATPTGGINGYRSYGPYKLTAYEDGKSFTITKNDKWYGYTDGKHKNQYQMEKIYTRIISEHTTARQEFEKGNLDDFGLNRTDMKDYGNSSRLTQTYESYTQKISFNSNREKLLARQKSAGSVNKTILANKDFREGLSLALNRNLFASQTTAGSKGFTGLLNDLYLSDVETGEMYRNTDQGKSVYNQVYSKLGGTPSSPKPLEESSCGYNFEMAVDFVAKAFTAEIASSEEGHLTANSKISLDFPVYDDQSETTIDMLNFLRQEFENVVNEANKKAGTSVTIEIKSFKDEDYYNTAKKGETEMIFSTWGGAAINPIGLMQVYCDSTFDSCCEYGFKGKQNEVYLDIDTNGDGIMESKTFQSWWTEINDLVEDKTNPNYEEQHKYILTVLAGLEAGILNRFEAVPIVARASSSLNSFKIENGSASYINLIGYGGVRHLTFNYTDAEWAQFVKDHNNNLSDLYKN